MQCAGVLPDASTQLTESSTTADTGSPICDGLIVAASAGDVHFSAVSVMVSASCAFASGRTANASSPPASGTRRMEVPGIAFTGLNLLAVQWRDCDRRSPACSVRRSAGRRAVVSLDSSTASDRVHHGTRTNAPIETIPAAHYNYP